MKTILKFIATIILLFMTIVPVAAQEQTPNRILVVNSNGNYQGYVVDHIMDMRFATVEGEVLAQVEIFDVQLELITLAITRTEACEAFRLSIVPQSVANAFNNDVSAISYVENNGSDKYYQDFTNAEVSGISLNAGVDYCLVTVGYDKYGVAAGVVKVPFTTPAPDIVGTPHVDAELVESTLDSFTISFTPNEDVSEYYLCSFEAGTIEEQFNMWSAWMGFASVSEMIEAWSWGTSYTGPTTQTWEYMDPGTDYEVAIAIKDANGNFAPYETFAVSTLSMGGTGAAYVDIEVGEYKSEDWYGDGNLVPTLPVTYTPNDQTSKYRTAVYLKSDIEQYGLDAIIDDLRSDPPMPGIAGWYIYDQFYNEYSVEPSTEVVILAAARNANDEWGEVNVVYYTTPDECPGYTPANAPNRAPKAQKGKITGRHTITKKANLIQPGKAPKRMPMVKKITLK